jgi:hypothetical protein
MGKKQRKQSNNDNKAQARPGVGNAGAALNPADLSEDVPATAPPPGAVPQGLPIDAREYDELQRRAKTRNLPRHDDAREDPSASP